MKRYLTLLAALAALTLALSFLAGCSGERKPSISAGIDACALCNMVIDRPNQACGYFMGSEFVTFDAPSCLLKSYDALRKDDAELPDEIYFTDYKNVTFHRAETTFFLLTDHIPTVMGARVICFGEAATAGSYREHDDEKLVDWMSYRLDRSVPDRQHHILIDSEGMHPESFDADKGELVELIVEGKALKDARTLSIKGYEDAGQITIPASGEQVSFRFWASRPGAGFPVVDMLNGNSLGMIKVSGAHTSDEEAL